MQTDLSQMTYGDRVASSHDLTISDMARMYNVSLRTLRFYEDKDLLNPRRQGTARFYSARDRIRLELVLKGKRLGFTLAEIFDLIASREKEGLNQSVVEDCTDLTVSLGRQQITNQIAHLERQRDELADAIDELKRARARLGEEQAA